MSLTSSTKVDVNTTELLFNVDAEKFSAAVEKAFQRGLQAERGYKKDVDISIEFETVEKTKEKDQELSR